MLSPHADSKRRLSTSCRTDLEESGNLDRAHRDHADGADRCHDSARSRIARMSRFAPTAFLMPIPRALADRHEHDVHDADAADDQRMIAMRRAAPECTVDGGGWRASPATAPEVVVVDDVVLLASRRRRLP
jgi:hypothetical protein